MKKLILITLFASSFGYAETIQTSRYTSVEQVIPQNNIDLLTQNISITFSPDIVTVGEAVNQLLENSGYQLTKYPDKYTSIMLKNKLPATQKSIKNANLEQVLIALTGKQFNIIDDPVNRIVGFKIKPKVLAIYLNNVETLGNNNE